LNGPAGFSFGVIDPILKMSLHKSNGARQLNQLPRHGMLHDEATMVADHVNHAIIGLLALEKAAVIRRTPPSSL
jgi:hypothetical protein